MTMQISLPALRYPSESSRRIFYDTVRNEIRRVPGVTGASACTLLPFGYGETAQSFQIVGQPGTAAPPFADVNKVLPGFFHTLRIPLLAGRYLDERDRPGSEPAILIDQNLARQYFPGKNPLGRQIELSVGHRFSVAGVVRNIKVDGLDITNRPMLYFSALQTPVTDMSLIVKTSQASDRLPEIVQDIVAKVDSGQPVYDIAPLTARVDQSLSTRRFVLFLLMSFAVTGTAITAIGLYGLLSYSVVVRRREFGIRAAVGAKPADLAVLVFRHGFLLCNLARSRGWRPRGSLRIALSSSANSMGVRVSDPFTWVSIAIVLATTATLVCLHPSWRASHTIPSRC